MLRQSLSRHTVPASTSFRGMFEPRSARREREQRPGASAAHAERRQAREPKVVHLEGQSLNQLLDILEEWNIELEAHIPGLNADM